MMNVYHEINLKYSSLAYLSRCISDSGLFTVSYIVLILILPFFPDYCLKCS